MKKHLLFLFIIFVFVLNAYTQDLLTIAERSNFTETSRYTDVLEFISNLQDISPLIKITNIGVTAEGRQIPMAILSKPPLSNPVTAGNNGKPVVLIMANIHAGEVEGKEASLMLMRELLTGSLGYVLETINLLVIPIFNADGNEKISKTNRRGQNGPSGGVGIRYNGQNLDLNRDYMKIESYEVKGLVDVFNEWDPAVFVDLHTTNGTYHIEPVTYSGPLNPVGNEKIIDYVWENLLPEITKNMEEKDGVLSIPYGGFMDYREMEKGWSTFSHEPRFGTNYYGLRNRMSVLVENYSYADFKTRVEGCYSLIKHLVVYASNHDAEILSLIREVDEETIRLGMNPPEEYTFGTSFEATPFDELITVKGYEYKVTQVEGRRFPRVEKTDVRRDYTLPYYAKYESKESVKMPFGYLLPKNCKEIIEKLVQHGIVVQQLTKAIDVDVEAFEISKVEAAPNLYQGHYLNTIEGAYTSEHREFSAGTYFVGMDQPYAPLAAYLLEPESDDGLAVWNYFDKFIASQWGRGHGTFPVYRIKYPVNVNTLIVK